MYGVLSAMPMFKALKACPDAVVIRPDFAKYVAVGRQIRAMMARLTPLLQPLSIDEAVLDLAGTEALHGAPPAIVLARFAREVEASIGVTVSIGLAANRLLAKIAAGRDKPRGFAVIGAREAASLLAPEPVRLLPGIGPALARRRASQGITLLGHLQALSDREARRRLGDEGPSLVARARGEDVRRVDPARETRSISAETTSDTDLTRPADLQAHLWRLAEKLARRLKEHELSAGGVVLKLKTTDFAIAPRLAPAGRDSPARPVVRRRQHIADARGHRHGVPTDRHRRQPAAAAGRRRPRRPCRHRDATPCRYPGGDRRTPAALWRRGDQPRPRLDPALITPRAAPQRRGFPAPLAGRPCRGAAPRPPRPRSVPARHPWPYGRRGAPCCWPFC
jgi:nucleotidyltransferase/DNA polymerase involved in DNA repair